MSYRNIFICGMANGCDLYFGEAVMLLKEQKSDVSLEAAIPDNGQADHWRAEDKQRWDAICAASDYITIVSPRYTRDCMQKRNQYMVDNASLLIAVYNGTTGGTLNTMLYAIRKKLEVIQILIEEE